MIYNEEFPNGFYEKPCEKCGAMICHYDDDIVFLPGKKVFHQACWYESRGYSLAPDITLASDADIAVLAITSPGSSYTKLPEFSFYDIPPLEEWKAKGLPVDKIVFEIEKSIAWRSSIVRETNHVDGWKYPNLAELRDVLQAANALTNPNWPLPERYLCEQ